MDPDECLKEIRTLVQNINSTNDPGVLSLRAGELAEVVEAMDEWLFHGGFLPLEWSDEYKAVLDGKQIIYRMPKSFDPRSAPHE